MALGAGEDGLELLRDLENGDRVALAKVTRIITGYLARFRAHDLADHWPDMTQEVLVALLKASRRGAIRDQRAFVSYTGTIVRNKLTDYFRGRDKPGAPDVRDDSVERALGDDAPHEPGADRRTADTLLDLDRALTELPDRERRVVEAVYIRGHSYEEAAQLLEMPLGTLKRLQSQSLKTLRKSMGVA